MAEIYKLHLSAYLDADDLRKADALVEKVYDALDRLGLWDFNDSLEFVGEAQDGS